MKTQKLRRSIRANYELTSHSLDRIIALEGEVQQLHERVNAIGDNMEELCQEGHLEYDSVDCASHEENSESLFGRERDACRLALIEEYATIDFNMAWLIDHLRNAWRELQKYEDGEDVGIPYVPKAKI